MFRSATFKLTMWYLAIVMTISLAFSVVLYNVATAELARGLHRETQRISSQFPVFQGDPLLKPGVDYDSGAHRILLRLLGFNVIVLGAAGVTSYWLARRTLEPIEQAHEQQKRFTADVSHELRTPLTALRMESEVALLNTKTSATDLRDTLTSNLEEVAKLEALINNLLRLTRLEADELQQQFTNVQTAEVVAEAVKQAETSAKARPTTIQVEGSDHELRGDHDSLVQLLVILLDNAIKYSQPGSSVTIQSQAANHQVSFEVTDSGAGISPPDLEHVFDRFYRADDSRATTETSGHGLGLSIAKMIADVHGGNITLRSRPGHGTTATVTLPVATEADTPQ